ncbi:MAG: hypothetical protein Ta2F_09140 [Termitinemataceae bacterium]|nr:MAG: hypothetical protein Ta2F_09140 [Termitinemataceae bacterium]
MINKNIRVKGAKYLEANDVDRKLLPQDEERLSAFVHGLALYGFPVTDVMLSLDGNELVQRFTKGYMSEILKAN